MCAQDLVLQEFSVWDSDIEDSEGLEGFRGLRI